MDPNVRQDLCPHSNEHGSRLTNNRQSILGLLKVVVVVVALEPVFEQVVLVSWFSYWICSIVP
jgi:hypothetical protein